MDEADMRRRFESSPVARLATVRPDGSPHVVPIVFALDGDTVYTAVDNKPKRSHRLQRMVNLEHESRCSVLVDHYATDWAQLWWVRADGHAALADPATTDRALMILAARYDVYRTDPPPGPVLAVRVERWSGWTAA